MGECVICLDNVPQVTFIDCGHACTCVSCALLWLTNNDTCPVCRKVVTQVESQNEIDQLKALLRERHPPKQELYHENVDYLGICIKMMGVILATWILTILAFGTTQYRTSKLQKAPNDLHLQVKAFLDASHDAANFHETVEKMSKTMRERDVMRVIEPVAKYLYDIEEFADMQDLYTRLIQKTQLRPSIRLAHKAQMGSRAPSGFRGRPEIVLHIK
jgi:hypothetical protein